MTDKNELAVGLVIGKYVVTCWKHVGDAIVACAGPRRKSFRM